MKELAELQKLGKVAIRQTEKDITINVKITCDELQYTLNFKSLYGLQSAVKTALQKVTNFLEKCNGTI